MAPGQTLPPSSTEAAFLLSALRQRTRVDGRLLNEPRELQVTFGDDAGNVTLSMGETLVLATTTATLSAPTSQRPHEGVLTISSDIYPLAGPQHDALPGRPTEAQSHMDRMVEKAIRRAEPVDREALCVVAGQKVWTLHLSLRLLSDAGNALDAMMLAGILSLRTFRRPDVTVESVAAPSREDAAAAPDTTRVRIYSPAERIPVPLSIKCTPLCVSWAFFKLDGTGEAAAPETNDADWERANDGIAAGADTPAGAGTLSTPEGVFVTVRDPSPLESTLASAHLSLVMTPTKEVCVLEKAGGEPLPLAVILRTIKDTEGVVVGLGRRVEEWCAGEEKRWMGID